MTVPSASQNEVDGGRIVQLAVGLPRTMGVAGASQPMQRPWRSGIFKTPTDRPIWLGQTNLQGDGQADLRVHGGPDKAVLIYAAAHYPAWQRELRRSDFRYGAFGENFTVEGLDEQSVNVGDVYEVGGALMQVTQPRQPCWKLSRRWAMRDLAKRAQDTGRLGWYCRVLRHGWVQVGQTLRLIDRPQPQWSIARLSELMHVHRDDLAAAAYLAECDVLSSSWRKTFRKRIERQQESDPDVRLIGPNDG